MQRYKKLILLLSIITTVYADLRLTQLGGGSHPPWEGDSIYIGLGLVSRDPSKDIEVIWKINYPEVLGQLYFMYPGIHDSAVFLFHNKIANFSNEESSINIGRFPTGTPIVFRYIQEEPTEFDTVPVGKKLYSGQNRVGIDEYISELGGESSPLKYTWAITGRVSNDTCEMGFASTIQPAWKEIRFFVTNVYREELDKYRIAAPVAEPASMRFGAPITLSLSSPCIKSPKIYYTLDGSTPDTNSDVYNGSIIISASTTLKAFARMEGDTQWVDSYITEENYVFDPSNIRGSALSRNGTSYSSMEYFTISGKRLRSGNIHRNSTGIYFVQAKDISGKRLLRRYAYIH